MAADINNTASQGASFSEGGGCYSRRVKGACTSIKKDGGYQGKISPLQL